MRVLCAHEYICEASRWGLPQAVQEMLQLRLAREKCQSPRALRLEKSHHGKANGAHPLVLWEAFSVDRAEGRFPSVSLLRLAVATRCRPPELFNLRRRD